MKLFIIFGLAICCAASGGSQVYIVPGEHFDVEHDSEAPDPELGHFHLYREVKTQYSDDDHTWIEHSKREKISSDLVKQLFVRQSSSPYEMDEQERSSGEFVFLSLFSSVFKGNIFNSILFFRPRNSLV